MELSNCNGFDDSDVFDESFYDKNAELKWAKRRNIKEPDKN